MAYRTVSGDAEPMRQLLDYVDGYVSERGMHVQRFTWNGFESLIATVKLGHKTPKVMLAAHADVVPAGDDMFTMRSEAGKYIGRGVLDMKFAIATYLQIIDDIKDDISNYDIGLMITSDEELGGMHGTARLIETGYLPQVCILPDGGENWQVQTASKGMHAFEVSMDGTTAHGSRPWLGDNALVKLITVLDEIAALFPKHPHPDTNTITLSKMDGGAVMNQVPSKAGMTLDIRTLNSHEHLRLYDAVHKVCRKYNASCVSVSDAAPTSSDLQDPLIAPFVRFITAVTGNTVTGSRALGASDARYFVPFGVPCISLYPTGLNLHADGEWIGQTALNEFKTVVASYLDEVARYHESDSPSVDARDVIS